MTARRLQRVQAGRADHGGDGAEGADRRRPHDHGEDAEDQLLDVPDTAQHRLARPSPCAWSANPASSATSSVWSTSPSVKAETIVVGMIPSRKSTRRLRRRRSACAWPASLDRLGQVQAAARLQDVADDQADGQRDRRHDHEVAEREPADGADLGGLAYRADAQHDRAEDDRRDHHLDQVHEAGAERLELDGEVGGGEAHGDAEHAPRRSRRCTDSGCGPAWRLGVRHGRAVCAATAASLTTSSASRRALIRDAARTAGRSR